PWPRLARLFAGRDQPPGAALLQYLFPPRHQYRGFSEQQRMTFGRAPRWATLGLVAAGAVHALTFAPGPLPAWALALVQILALACVAHATLRAASLRQSLLRGWLFNFASYSLGLYWIFVSLHYYGGLAA